MKKKFKLRLTHYSGEYYIVEYAYYWFIPVWYYIVWWSEHGYTSRLEQFTPTLVKIGDEENIKKQFPTMESICAFHAIEQQKQQEFYIKQKAYLATVTPYKTKTLIQ